MDRHLEIWEQTLLLRSFRAAPEFAEEGLSQGFGTVLLRVRDSAHSFDAADRNRLFVLLAVAAGGPPHPDVPLHLEAACRDWCRGDRAMTSIRLAFAPVAKLADAKDAYRLFLAEQAFEAGLDAETILREFGLADAAVLLKYDPDQPRVPAGSGRESGRFGSASGAPASTAESGDEARVMPVFFDPHEAHGLKDKEVLSPSLLGPKSHRFGEPGLSLDPDQLSLPLPIPFPFPNPQPEEKDGPECPAMLPDRKTGEKPNVPSAREEFRVAALVNPESPTPKWIPEQPDVVSMAYYLKTKAGTQTVAIDDCKRTSSPSPIDDIRKGDMIEVKTASAAWLIWRGFAQDYAGRAYDTQVERQISVIRLEGKGRQLIAYVGNAENVQHLTKRYEDKDYRELHFTVCK